MPYPHLDGSVQPFALVVPEGPQAGPRSALVWLLVGFTLGGLVLAASIVYDVRQGQVQRIESAIDFHMNVEAAVGSPRVHAQFIPETVLAEPELPAELQGDHQVILDDNQMPWSGAGREPDRIVGGIEDSLVSQPQSVDLIAAEVAAQDLLADHHDLVRVRTLLPIGHRAAADQLQDAQYQGASHRVAYNASRLAYQPPMPPYAGAEDWAIWTWWAKSPVQK